MHQVRKSKACLGREPSKSITSTTQSTIARRCFCSAILRPTLLARSNSGRRPSASGFCTFLHARLLSASLLALMSA